MLSSISFTITLMHKKSISAQNEITFLQAENWQASSIEEACSTHKICFQYVIKYFAMF